MSLDTWDHTSLKFLLQITSFTNKGQIGCLDIAERQHIYLVEN